MGDDRNIVYEEDGVWVYRASSIGGCERALVAARRLLTPLPPPDTLQRAFDQGHVAEEPILKRFFEDHPDETRLTEPPSPFVVIEGGQFSVRLPVQESNAVIRGALDALSERAGKLTVIDAKALGKDLYSKLEKKGAAILPTYAPQQTIYMAGVGATRAILACGLKDEDGIFQPDAPVQYIEIPFDVNVLNAMHAKVRRIEDMAGGHGFPDCDTAGGVWGCPYTYLHDEPEWNELKDKADWSRVDVAREMYTEAGTLEKRAKALKSDAKNILAPVVQAYLKANRNHVGPVRVRSAQSKLTWIREEVPERTSTTRAYIKEYPKLTPNKEIDL